MAAPLLHEEGALGVLSVLDRPEQTLFSLQEMELLGLFANQAAIAVDLLLKARKANLALRGKGELELVSRLAAAVDALEDERREAGLRLLESSPRCSAQRKTPEDQGPPKKGPGGCTSHPGLESLEAVVWLLDGRPRRLSSTASMRNAVAFDVRAVAREPRRCPRLRVLDGVEGVSLYLVFASPNLLVRHLLLLLFE